MSLKLQIVSEIEQGECSISGAKRKYGIQGDSTITNWLRKYGTFDRRLKYQVICQNQKKSTYSRTRKTNKALRKTEDVFRVSDRTL